MDFLTIPTLHGQTATLEPLGSTWIASSAQGTGVNTDIKLLQLTLGLTERLRRTVSGSR